METVGRCLTEWEAQVSQQQMLYFDSQGMMLGSAMAQWTENLRVFVHHWARREVRHVVKVLSVMERSIFL